ncbi:thioredoxin-like fold domain-containing protein MRL7L, chloroplastic isoform X1 [Arachis hypogaea]|uniref:thioredoxin-like fold domain-containing protein MRL7L, chloroplastic isoform X1 n=2 Tax=Arachis hypogaea TaxID=3818 RepID=UPI000DEDDB4E|nr:thioredoxin-like fold domain-containing protein MRL7L, chloroplastic isoform X1 [Arachis hypogaea]
MVRAFNSSRAFLCRRKLKQLILVEMALPNSMTLPLSSFVSPTFVKKRNLIIPKQKQLKLGKKFLNQVGDSKVIRVPTRVQALKSDDADWKRRREASSDSDDEEDTPPSFDQNDPYSMSLEERLEWRRKIREVMDRKPEVQEELDPEEKKRKFEKLLNDYQLVVEEEDPDWPEDADGRGFNLGQFFDKITIKNTKKANDDDDDDDDKEEIEWRDDNYIRPIKDIKTAEWEETVFKDISPLIILVHNRYRRPKENEKIRNELEKAVHIIWNCRLPSPRCIALDAVVETELVDALQVSVFPEIIFTKAGKILYREKALRNADELSKIMAFFYYGAAKPPCLNSISDSQEDIPSVSIDNPVS